jgi:hypothetical protein
MLINLFKILEREARMHTCIYSISLLLLITIKLYCFEEIVVTLNCILPRYIILIILIDGVNKKIP